VATTLLVEQLFKVNSLFGMLPCASSHVPSWILQRTSIDSPADAYGLPSVYIWVASHIRDIA